MSNDLAVFSGAGLPTAVSKEEMVSALRGMKQATTAGVTLLKMDKTGHWVFGADQEEIQEGSKWAVNPFSFVHGYIAWGEGAVLAEKMVHITKPLPELDAAPAAAKRGWETQLGMVLKCVNGEDAGTEVRFTTTSYGGKGAVVDLGTALATQVATGTDKVMPIVTLSSSFYTHKEYGRIFTPIFTIVEWRKMTPEDPAPEASPPAEKAKAPVADENEEEVTPAPQQRRRRAAA